MIPTDRDNRRNRMKKKTVIAVCILLVTVVCAVTFPALNGGFAKHNPVMAEFYVSVDGSDGNDGSKEMKTFTKSIGTTFVEFPLNIKYRSKRYNNVAAYLIAGASPKLYFSFKKSGTDINWLNPKPFDFALELGTGFDIYNQWFKMGLEVKMSYGMLDIVKEEAFIYTAPIDKLRNKMFQVSLLFE